MADVVVLFFSFSFFIGFETAGAILELQNFLCRLFALKKL